MKKPSFESFAAWIRSHAKQVSFQDDNVVLAYYPHPKSKHTELITSHSLVNCVNQARAAIKTVK